VALLILSVLSTDRLNESEARSRALAALHPLPDRERCPHTGMKSFLNAFAALLVGTGKASAVIEITVSRTADRASFRYYDAGADHEIKTSQWMGSAAIEPGISVSASLSHNLLMQISADVQAIVLEGFNREEA
jgi:hypothetical protein